MITYSSRLWLPYVKLFRLWNFYDLFRPPSTFELFVLTILRLNSKLPIEEGNFRILIRQRLEHADADRYQANLKKVYNKIFRDDCSPLTTFLACFETAIWSAFIPESSTRTSSSLNEPNTEFIRARTVFKQAVSSRITAAWRAVRP